ncbi:dipeptidyl peptidase III [Penicillium malachiteum]|nr:dipeptidyl peptidase III [Penicillium malachiteum]
MATLIPSKRRAATHQLAIKNLFDGLTQRERLYAHHLAQAAWHGSRIILRETSAEGPGMLDLILELYKACGGKWDNLSTTVAESQLDADGLDAVILVEPGDHSIELSKICSALSEAVKYAACDKQASLSHQYIGSFKTGNLEAYRESQKIWVTDVSLRVENILGFVEPYRDPYGVRAEWEGAFCISDPDETSKLKAIVDDSTKFIRLLPWAVPGENDGKGPFEANLFQAPDFTIVHSLAFCTSFVWEAVNLPNYSDIREACRLKNIVFANRMNVNSNLIHPCRYLYPSVAREFGDCNPTICFIVTAVHELLGHGTGKLLSESSSGTYNFDRNNLPINPLTGEAIQTWYRPGQTWTSVFEKLATSVEECRVMLVSYYLAEGKELLAIFGYNDTIIFSADDITYFTYLHVGVEGIKALQAFNAQDRTWGQPHARANFAILKHLLLDGDGAMTVEHDSASKTVHVHVKRSKISSSGKASLGRMLCRIHVWRCIADVKSCREFYEPLSVVDGEYEAWRQIVISNPEPNWKFVQPNTILKENGEVDLKTYQSSNEGIIQSFAERDV